jgi:hypothetical protein
MLQEVDFEVKLPSEMMFTGTFLRLVAFGIQKVSYKCHSFDIKGAFSNIFLLL